MSTTLGCLVFLRLASASAQLPAHVESLLLERVRAGIESQAPDLDIRFDRDDCEDRATYAFGLDSLVLEGASKRWTGRALVAIPDLLDGRRIDYGPYLRHGDGDTPRTVVPIPVARDESSARPWLLGLGGGAIGAGAGAIFSPNDASRPLNAVVFGLGGALLGSILGFVF